jgi:protein-tyrosine phosphatase
MIEIIKNVFLGDLKDAKKFTGNLVINLSEDCLFDKYGSVMYFNIPMLDSEDFPIQRYFDYIYCLIITALEKYHKILINCYAGMSRSVTIYAMFLMRYLNITHDKALEIIDEAKPIDPNDGFINKLKKYGHIDFK